MRFLTSMQNKFDFPLLLFAGGGRAEGKTGAVRPKTQALSRRTKVERPMLAAPRARSVKNLLRLGLMHIMAALTFMTFGTALAADFDGSKLLICATVDAMDCVSGEDCTTGRPGDMGAPAFLRIDFAQKTIGGPNRTAPIVSMDTSGEQILLQGKEQGYGWTFALNQEGGKFSATLVNRDGVFVLFGSCTPL
jgi:hypothetical protein